MGFCIERIFLFMVFSSKRHTQTEKQNWRKKRPMESRSAKSIRREQLLSSSSSSYG